MPARSVMFDDLVFLAVGSRRVDGLPALKIDTAPPAHQSANAAAIDDNWRSD